MSRPRALPWLALAVVLGTALVIGARHHGPPPTDAQRVQRIAAGIRCPTCRSESAADSDAPSSQAIREEILRRVRLGESDHRIRAYLASRYTEAILLSPAHHGVGLVVWLLPVAAFAAALAGLAVAFRRWRPRRRHASSADRALVDSALVDSALVDSALVDEALHE